MARSLRIEYPGAFYHVTSRGNEHKDVFKSQKDREKFLSYLESTVVRYGAVVHAWCLMGNPYHLLRETAWATCRRSCGTSTGEVFLAFFDTLLLMLNSIHV